MLPQIGDTIGGGAFTITKRLGAGAMGAVFAAKQLELDRTVAIKFIQESLEGVQEERPMAIKRLQDEAMAASRIVHDNLVEIYDTGTDATFGPFIVYEYIEGLSLRQRLKNDGPLGWPRAYEVVGIPLLGALAALHQKGIIHRDVKPDNILTTDKNVIKLADLGLAQFSDRSAHTRAGIIIGTPGYIAPEGAMGDNSEPTAAYDIYSAAIVLYEAATGHIPFKAKGALDIVREQLTREITPSDLTKGGLPTEASTCLSRAMSIKSEKRPTTVEEFQRAIEDTNIRLDGDVTTKKVRPGSEKKDEREEEQKEPRELSDEKKGALASKLFWLAIVIPVLLLAFSFLNRSKPAQRTLLQQKEELLVEVSAIVKELVAYPCCNERFDLEFEPAIKRLFELKRKLNDKRAFGSALKKVTGSSFFLEILEAALKERELKSYRDICTMWTKKAIILWRLNILKGKRPWDEERLCDSIWLLHRATRPLRNDGSHWVLQEELLHQAFLFCSYLREEQRVSKETKFFRAWLFLEFARSMIIVDKDPRAFEDMAEGLSLIFSDPGLCKRQKLSIRLGELLQIYRDLPRGNQITLRKGEKELDLSRRKKTLELSKKLTSPKPVDKNQFNDRVDETRNELENAEKEVLSLIEKETWDLKTRMPGFMRPFRSYLWLAAARAAIWADRPDVQLDFVRAIDLAIDKRKEEMISTLSAMERHQWYWMRGLTRKNLFQQGTVALNEIHSTLRDEMAAQKEHPWHIEQQLIVTGKEFLDRLHKDDENLDDIWTIVLNDFDDRLPAKYLFLSYGRPTKEQKQVLLDEASERLLVLSKGLTNKSRAELILKMINE